MDYGEVLRKSWDITWRYKGLWVLGILAGCASGGGFGSPGGGVNPTLSTNGDFNGMTEGFEALPDGAILAIIFALLCLFLLLAIVFFLLGTIGQAGLIAGFNHADGGKDISLREAFRLGWPHFWRLLILQILLFDAFLFAALVVGMFIILTFGIALLCLLPMLIILIPLGIAISLYIMLVKVSLVVEQLGVFDAFRRAYDVGRDNLGPVIVTGLILLILGFAVSFIVAMPLIGLGFLAFAGFIIGGEESILLTIGLMTLCFVIYLPILILARGMISTYVFGTWTVTYRRLTGLEAKTPPAIAAAATS